MNKNARWPHLLAAIVNGFFIGILLTWSYFREELAKIFPTWDAGELSLVFSVHNVAVWFFLLATGYLLKRVSGRVMIFTAGTMLLTGLGLFPLLPLDRPGTALFMAAVLFGAVAAGSIGMGAVAGNSVYLRWVPDHAGKLIGAAALATSISPLVMGALCSRLVPVFGILQSMRIIGIIGAALVYATLPLAVPPGPDVRLPPAPVRAENPDQRDYRPAEMLRLPSFWILLAFNAFIRWGGLIIIDFGGSIAVHFGVAAIFGLLFSPANGTANVAGGILADRFSTARVMLLCGGVLLLGALLMLAGNAAGSAFLALAGLIVGGLSYGCCTVHCAASIRNLYGMKHYAQNWGYVQSSIPLAACGGYLAGRLLDAQGGNYQGVFLLVLFCSLAGGACGLGMWAFMRRQSRARAAEGARMERPAEPLKSSIKE